MPTRQQAFGHATKRLTVVELGQRLAIINDSNFVAVAGFAAVGILVLACLLVFFPLLDISAAFSEFL
jgi:hypothetical protein